MRRPDFEHNTLRVLNRQKPERTPLFELFLNDTVYRLLAGHPQQEEGELGRMKFLIDAMSAGGYDYATVFGSGFRFLTPHRDQAETKSLNGNALISDWKSFEEYPWPDPDAFDYSALEKIRPYLPDGMKLMVMSEGGVLENVISIVGYDNLCILLYEEPELVAAIFDQVGSRLLGYYERSVQNDSVGILSANDDWGFNTQTFLSPADMRKYVFPWHKKIVAAAHRQGKPCILHSCGYFEEIIDDVIDGMQFNGRHSYEDNIMPVEEAYEKYHSRIAIMGGIDMNFLVTRTPEEVYRRSREMVERTQGRGNYLLGSGNSIPEYVPVENYLAMTKAALEA